MGVSLVAPAGRVPRLQVAHPAADGETGDVYASCCRNGNWWFWWPWAERIAEEGDLDVAAAIIEEALAARLRHSGRRYSVTCAYWLARGVPPGRRGPARGLRAARPRRRAACPASRPSSRR